MNRFKSILTGATAAALISTASGSAAPPPFLLGTVNSINATTVLTGAVEPDAQLDVINKAQGAAVRGESYLGVGILGIHTDKTGTDPAVLARTNSTDPDAVALFAENLGDGPALSLLVGPKQAPMRVNSDTKVDNLNADLLDGLDVNELPYWKLGGNAGTSPGTNSLGTTDNQALELKVNGQRALRIEPNAASPDLIGGYSGNSVGVGVYGATIGGGGEWGSENTVTGRWGTVGGGSMNNAGGFSSTVAGGEDNRATTAYSTIAGGFSNRARGYLSTIAGGQGNLADSNGSVGGGFENTASGGQATIAGGSSNTASGFDSVVAGGSANTASGYASAVVGGEYNIAGGATSFAGGLRAKAMHDGSFVWGDRSASTGIASPAADTFTVRAAGGIWLGATSSPVIPAGHFIETDTGAYLTRAGTWTNASDRTRKHDLRTLDKRALLEKVARMPITSWSYKKEQPGIRHIGPMAQDFYNAFGLGLDDKHITTIDEGGVALAAIQGLYRQNQALQRRVARLERALARGERRNR